MDKLAEGSDRLSHTTKIQPANQLIFSGRPFDVVHPLLASEIGKIGRHRARAISDSFVPLIAVQTKLVENRTRARQSLFYRFLLFQAGSHRRLMPVLEGRRAPAAKTPPLGSSVDDVVCRQKFPIASLGSHRAVAAHI